MSNHGVSNCLRVGRGALIAHFRDEAIIVVGMVVDSLNTSVREIDGVGTLHNTVTIIGLLLVEGSSRVVISNSIVVVVGGYLSQVRGTIGGGRVAVDRSMGNSNRVSNSRGSMDHWAVSNQGGRVNQGGNRVGKTMGNRVGNHTTGSMEPVRGVRH